MSIVAPDPLALPEHRDAITFIHLPELTDDLQPHRHGAYQLIVVLLGRLRIELSNAEYVVSRPGGAFIWPGVPHAARAVGGNVELLALQVAEAAIEHAQGAMAIELAAPAAGVMTTERVSPVIRELAFDLSTLPSHVQPTEYLRQTYRYLCYALTRWIHHEQSAVASTGAQLFASDYVARAVHHMRANLEAPLEVEQLARRAGTSPRNLSRSFQAELGTTPIRYYTQLRIERAAELLTHTDDDVQAIATSLGFRSMSHFGRTFRQATGCTPLEHRAAATMKRRQQQ